MLIDALKYEITRKIWYDYNKKKYYLEGRYFSNICQFEQIPPMQTKKLLTLKEASRISGYSSDYLGQLIRSGKIRGEKVFCQVTWKIDLNDLENYKNSNSGNNASVDAKKEANNEIKKINSRIRAFFNRIKSELLFLKLLLKNIKTILPLITVFLFCFVFISFFILDLIFNQREYEFSKTKAQEQQIETVSMY